MRKNIVKEKSFDFALKIIAVNRELVTNQKEFVLSKQLLRSDTAIGALIRASEHAESKKDFIHKLSISLKEANESAYWIDLLHQSNYISEEQYVQISEGVTHLNRLLISIIKKTKENLMLSKNN